MSPSDFKRKQVGRWTWTLFVRERLRLTCGSSKRARTPAGDTLLATLDATRKQVLREVEDVARKADDSCTGIQVTFHGEDDRGPDCWLTDWPESAGPPEQADTLVELLELLAR